MKEWVKERIVIDWTITSGLATLLSIPYYAGYVASFRLCIMNGKICCVGCRWLCCMMTRGQLKGKRGKIPALQPITQFRSKATTLPCSLCAGLISNSVSAGISRILCSQKGYFPLYNRRDMYLYREMRQGQLAFHSLRVGGVVNVASVAAAVNQLNCGLEKLVLVSLPSWQTNEPPFNLMSIWLLCVLVWLPSFAVFPKG